MNTNDYSITIFVVFHNNIHIDFYSALTEEEKNYITYYGVRDHITVTNGTKVIYEEDMPIYNEKLQKNKYNEASALYHIWKNNLFQEHKYIGFFQYYMKFNKNTINEVKNIIENSETADYIFYVGLFPSGIKGGQTSITHDYPNEKLEAGLKNYNKFFNTNFSNDILYKIKMLVGNSFIIPSHIYNKMMNWLTASYYKDEISTSILDINNVHHFNAGHVIEALTGMFLGLEVEQQNAKYYKLNVGLTSGKLP